jgi:large subunit ribosomal protein L15
VTVSLLRSDGLVKGRKGAPVKLLGRGEIDRSLVVKVSAFSQTAREKIEAAGGTCEVAKN